MKKETKFKLLKFAALIGVAALFWVLGIGGETGRGTPGQPPPQAIAEPSPPPAATQTAERTPRQLDKPGPSGRTSAPPAAEAAACYGRDEVAAYIRKNGGKLPPNFITKEQARELGWQGGPLEPYAPGKAIGGDRFGNYDGKLPRGNYRECDIGTHGKPRGAKRLVFTTDGRNIYYTEDHYETFVKLGTGKQ
ncbi:MAG: hypothetical protein IKH04_04725 [Kiritimatiellae bacterium]|nr:hypothetical protein [Kiritimatiellia bacterium]